MNGERQRISLSRKDVGKFVRGALVVATVAVGTIGSSGCDPVRVLKEVNNKTGSSETTGEGSVSLQTEYKKPDTSGMPNAVEVMKVMNYIEDTGKCPPPDQVGDLVVANPEINGGICEGN